MATIADDDPPTLVDLKTYQARGRAWVATIDAAGDDVAVAYLLVDAVDAAAHVEQVSVDPAYARRGLSRQLINTAASWAVQQGLDTSTLTTFAEVPWNEPYYARLGCSVVTKVDLGRGSLAIRRRERELGLNAWARVGMSRRLPGQNAADT